MIATQEHQTQIEITHWRIWIDGNGSLKHALRRDKIIRFAIRETSQTVRGARRGIMTQ